MTTLYIGAKFDGHDSAIFLIDPKNKKVYGLSSERVTGLKHDDIFPIPALERIIQYAQILPKTISKIHFANSFSSDYNTEYPINKFDIDLSRRTKRDSPVFIKPKPKNKSSKVFETLHQCMKRHLERLFPFAEISISHHDHEYCHALSSYFFSPFKSALVVTMDGSGDDGIFSRSYIAKDGELTLIGSSQSRYRIYDQVSSKKPFSKPCTVGGIYSYFTYKLGYRANCDEGKVEGLAALGSCITELYDHLMKSVSFDLKSYSINFNVDIVQKAIENPLLQHPTTMEEKANLAATVQYFTEEVVLSYLKHIVSATKISTLCLSGGVFANVILNMKIIESISKNIYIVPAVGDDGSAQGACVAELLNNGYNHHNLDWLRNLEMPYFGTSYSRDNVLNILSTISEKINYEDLKDEWPENIAELIYSGKIGAIFQGRMEWGPRALGNRSILVNPTDPQAKDIINGKVKKRPFFQPVCPAMLEEEMDRLFEYAYPNKHMTCAFKMKSEFYPFLPGAIHVDGTSRVQFVKKIDNPTLYRILQHLKELSGYGAVLNTSFNMHGRTIVESPKDALQDFLDMGLDFLLIEGFLVTRK